MKKTLKGFTLIEMLIVIVIIGILAAVLLPKIGGARDKANDVAVTANVKNLGTALISYEMDNGKYPEAITGLLTTDLIEKYGITVDATDGANSEKFLYATADSNTHFVICGKYSENNNAGNSNGTVTCTTDDDTTTCSLGTRSYNTALTDSGNWFCYKG